MYMLVLLTFTKGSFTEGESPPVCLPCFQQVLPVIGKSEKAESPKSNSAVLGRVIPFKAH